MIPRRAVWCLGLSQLVAWGTTYYLIGAFGDDIAADLGWSREAVYGGFSAALLVMGLTSGTIGGLIDRFGGRWVMSAGAVIGAAGCALLAASHDSLVYYGAWLVLGLGMRLTLYDAAFAALAGIAGREARRPISQITLLGGLASSVFWPLGSTLELWLGWRGTVLVYGSLLLLTIPLFLTLPRGTVRASLKAAPSGVSATGDVRRPWLVAALYAFIITAANVLNSAMSAHMIAILSGLGLAVAAAVAASSLRGIGQSCARLTEVLFGGRLHPLSLAVLASAIVPFGFAVGIAAGGHWLAASVFALAYGAGNGLLTIVRGTVPLVLFDPDTYGRFVGRLIAPSFILSAGAPLAFAALISAAGPRGALVAGGAMALAAAAAAVWLQRVAGPSRDSDRIT